MAEHSETEKALQELQERYTTNVQVLQRVSQQERSTTMTKQRLELVLSELQALPDTTPTYRQIGRAYFLDSHANIMKEGRETIAEAAAEIETLKQKRGTLEDKLTETKKELTELIKA